MKVEGGWKLFFQRTNNDGAWHYEKSNDASSHDDIWKNDDVKTMMIHERTMYVDDWKNDYVWNKDDATNNDDASNNDETSINDDAGKEKMMHELHRLYL